MPMYNFQLGTIVGWVKAAGRNPSKPKRWVTLRSTHPTENHIEAYLLLLRQRTAEQFCSDVHNGNHFFVIHAFGADDRQRDDNLAVAGIRRADHAPIVTPGHS